jgi:hypothetical protein
MFTVWKYPLEVDDLQDVMMPASAQVLHVGEQLLVGPRHRATSLALWALVDTNAPVVPFRIRIAGTGHALPPTFPKPIGDNYIGTVVTSSGLVWHAFDAREEV